jgi:sigma-B regulation protein RsbU (phosphoserine phosphatase)
MENVAYREYELFLEPGDKIFLYTDGLPEATDPAGAMFGKEKILEALNEAADASPRDTLNHVTDAVNEFVRDAEQFDDLTMLCLEYRGPQGSAQKKNELP